MVFYDILDTISDEPLLVEAEISLLSTKDGGRQLPITEKYRPNHNFGEPDNCIFYIGQVELKKGEWLYPSQSKLLLVTFLDAKGLREKLTIGREWRIQEGAHLVGKGIVKYVMFTGV